MNDTVYLFAPLLFFFIMTLIVSQVGNSISQVQAINSFITCQYPDWNNGINNATLKCSHVNHPLPYRSENFTIWRVNTPSCVFFSCGGGGNNWTATVPFGAISFTSDVITSVLGRIGDLISVVQIIGTMQNNLPLQGQYLLSIVYIIFIIMFAYGFWINVAVRMIGAIRG